MLCKDLQIADKVEFPGWLSHEENYREYAKAMVYVSIPRSDATSVSVLEAMANGCLPVTSDLPAMREWIKQESNGFLIADADSDFLTQAMAVDWEGIQAVNRDLIRQKASREVCLQKFLTLYDQLSGK